MEASAQQFATEATSNQALRADVESGLGRASKVVPSKYLYDGRGAQLFDAICRLPEYYPTRTERAILRDRAEEIAKLAGGDCVLIEPGSGSSEKVRLLLDAFRPRAYVPIDICRDYVARATLQLREAYPELDVHARCGDFGRFDMLTGLPRGRRIVFFPGSTIGNFEPADALDFLRRLKRVAAPDGAVLIGVDLKKDPVTLHRAYNDADGITAAFNLNLLERLNRELGADFVPAHFHHYAFYNVAKGRVEMHLVSGRTQTVHVANHRFAFRAGEGIHTENSYKYTIDGFQALAALAGWRPDRVWTDPQALFSVHYLTVAPGAV